MNETEAPLGCFLFLRKSLKKFPEKIWGYLFAKMSQSIHPTTTPRASQKPPSADISETESGIIDPLVSKRPENILNIKKSNQIGFTCDFLDFLSIFLKCFFLNFYYYS